jgi:hypothetical protein
METYTAPAVIQSPLVPDRAILRAGLEATRADFRRLLDAASGDRWRSKSPSSAWTVGEVLVHLTWALEYLPKEVEMARQGKGMFNMPKWLADPGSYWMIRWQARKSDPESVRRRYDAAIDAAIAALEAVPDTDWHLGAPFYGHGFHTVAALFETPARHLAEHTGQR